MAPLDAVHDAVKRTVQARTAKLRIATVTSGPAPYCSLAKQAQLEFAARVALVQDPPWSVLDHVVHVMNERWARLADDDDEEEEADLRRVLYVDDVRYDSMPTGWTRFGGADTPPDPGPFGIFDRLALADAAVAREGVLRFRTVSERLGPGQQAGDLSVDAHGRIAQVVFWTAVPGRPRMPLRLNPPPIGIQVDVLELGTPVDIDVPDPLPGRWQPEPVSWPELGGRLWRRYRAARSGT